MKTESWQETVEVVSEGRRASGRMTLMQQFSTWMAMAFGWHQLCLPQPTACQQLYRNGQHPAMQDIHFCCNTCEHEDIVHNALQ